MEDMNFPYEEFSKRKSLYKYMPNWMRFLNFLSVITMIFSFIFYGAYDNDVELENLRARLKYVYDFICWVKSHDFASFPMLFIGTVALLNVYFVFRFYGFGKDL